MEHSNRLFRKLLAMLILLVISGMSFSQQNIGGYNVYYGHLHNHTEVSDGTGTLDDAYIYAKNTAGLDFFGLSDHANQIDANEWTATKSAADLYNEEGVFVAFSGFEWSHNTLGHVTIVNSEDYCNSSNVTSFPELLSWLSSRECVAFFNHPGRQNSTGVEFDHFADSPSDKFVGMELWNKADAFNVYYYNDGYYTNDGNLGFFDEAIARGWKIGAGGSEDNHDGDWGTRIESKMAVLSTGLTRTDIYNALKNKRFYTTLDKNLKMSFKINGSEMGSTLEGNSGQSLQILVSDNDGEIFSKVELIKNGIVYQTWTPNVSDVNISETLTTSDGDYYYIKVTQEDNDEAISSPVFIEGGIINTPPVCTLTKPQNGEHYSSTQSINISADASDPGGSVSHVEFFANGTSIGIDNSASYSVEWTIPENNAYIITAKATDNLGVSTTSSPVEITVGTFSNTVSSRISNGNDDVEESEAGVMYITSTDLELVYDDYQTAGNQTVGLRFTGLGIPQGAFITNAYIQFTADETINNNGGLTIKGHNIDDSPTFSTSSFDVSSRSKTSTSVTWNPPTWLNADDTGVEQQTPDLSAVIQEIVNRPGFSQSSAISLIITGTGTRTAEAYEGNPSAAPELYVEYSNEVNTSPVFWSDQISKPNATEDATYSETIAGSATDDDGDQLSYSIISGPNWLSINSDGSISGTPNNDNVGINTWTVQASDGNGGTDQATLQITVENTNDVPIFNSNPIILSGALVGVNYSGNIADEATDIDHGDVITFLKVSGPDWLSISSEGVLSGVPEIEDIGPNSWIIQVADGNEGIARATLEIEVNQPSAYCESSGISDSEWIKSIQIDVIENQSENNGGYKDFTTQTPFSLETNSSVSFVLTPGFSGRSTHQYWSIWIDFDKNGNFDSDEFVFSSIKSKSSVSGSFQTNSNIGITRMRISMSDSGTPQACGSVGSGEVEDYLVNISQSGINPPVVNFEANKINVLTGETVNFSDLSLNNPDSWDWDFGDGLTSNNQNPSIAYTSAGTYSVSLTVANIAGTDTKTITDYINVSAPSEYPPIADFTANPVEVLVGEPVDFTDNSSNNPISWLWDFGNEQTSDLQNPSITYSNPGIYTVSLTTTNAFGDGQITKTDLITVSPIPVGEYCEPVNIDNTSDYIVTLVIDGVEYTSDENSNGYNLVTTPSLSFDSGGNYSFTLQPHNSKNRNFWRIWIDLNGDGDFDDINETLYVGNNKKGTVSGNINIPEDTNVSNTRMRITMKTGSSPSTCDDNFNGEVEDYIISILPAIESAFANKSGSIQTNSAISIEEDIKVSLNIYPNPATNKLFIQSNGWKGQKEIRVLDIAGRSILIQNSSNDNSEVDVSNLPGGIYFISVKNATEKVVRKIKVR